MYKSLSQLWVLLAVSVISCSVTKPKKPIGHEPEFAAMMLTDQLMAPVIADSFRLTADTVGTVGASVRMPHMALYDIKTSFSKGTQQMTLQMDSMRIHPDSAKVTGGTLKLLSSNWKPTERLDSSAVVVTLQNVYQFKGRRATWCSRLMYNYLNKAFILKCAEKVPCNN